MKKISLTNLVGLSNKSKSVVPRGNYKRGSTKKAILNTGTRVKAGKTINDVVKEVESLGEQEQASPQLVKDVGIINCVLSITRDINEERNGKKSTIKEETRKKMNDLLLLSASKTMFEGKEANQDPDTSYMALFAERYLVFPQQFDIGNKVDAINRLMQFACGVLKRPVAILSIIMPLKEREKKTMEEENEIQWEDMDDCVTQATVGEVLKLKSMLERLKGVEEVSIEGHMGITAMVDFICEDKYYPKMTIERVYNSWRNAKLLDMMGDRSLSNSKQVDKSKELLPVSQYNLSTVVMNSMTVLKNRLEQRLRICPVEANRKTYELRKERKYKTIYELEVIDKEAQDFVVDFISRTMKQMNKYRTGLKKKINDNTSGVGSIKHKVEAGRMLDPKNPKSTMDIDVMLYTMWRAIWEPVLEELRRCISEQNAEWILEITKGNIDPVEGRVGYLKKMKLDKFAEALVEWVWVWERDEARRTKLQGIWKELIAISRLSEKDISNVIILLLLMMHSKGVPLRPQITVGSRVDAWRWSEGSVGDNGEQVMKIELVHEGKYKASESQGAKGKARIWIIPPFMTSMIIVYKNFLRKAICGADKREDMFLTQEGKPLTNSWITHRLRFVGNHFLGMQRMSLQIFRTFQLSKMAYEGSLTDKNVEDVARVMQTSSANIQKYYVDRMNITKDREVIEEHFSGDKKRPPGEMNVGSGTGEDNEGETQRKRPRRGTNYLGRWEEDLKKSWTMWHVNRPKKVRAWYMSGVSGKMEKETFWSDMNFTSMEKDYAAFIKSIKKMGILD
jgi:hypothetical protein